MSGNKTVKQLPIPSTRCYNDGKCPKPGEPIILQNTDMFNKLIQERQVIQSNIGRISDLSDDLVKMADLQNNSSEFTPYQVNRLNEKRINLRHNIINLKDGLQIHYGLGEEILRPLVGLSLLQTLVIKHREILKKLSEVDALILNLSPLGILFNSAYIKSKIIAICRILNDLNFHESSLLAFSGISRDEEPV
jgi:hypothetical protein